MAKDLKGKKYNDFSSKELQEVRNILSKNKTLTPSEASILLQIPLDGIYKLIKKGAVVAFHPFGIKSRWLVNVEATLKNLYGNEVV